MARARAAAAERAAWAALALLGVLAAAAAAAAAPLPHHSFDGSGNHAQHDEWGRAQEPLGRFAGFHYADGASSMLYADRPSCCAVQDAFRQHFAPKSMTGNSLMLMAFSQFAWSHDVGLTEESGEPFTTDVDCLSRKTLLRAIGLDGTSPLQHPNEVTPYLDLNTVYGNSAERAAALRANDGSGRLLTSMNGLPPKLCRSRGVKMANPVGLDAENDLFCVGDIRGNENTMLLSLHILFLREHNRLAGEIRRKYPTWNDDQIFFKARSLNIAQYQRIAVYEFGQALLGQAQFDALIGTYTGYDASRPAQTFAEYSQGVGRIFHGMIRPTVPFTDALNQTIERDIGEMFFAPYELVASDIDPALKGLAFQPAGKVWMTMPEQLLSGVPSLFSPSLAAKDCLRSRDFGLADYNTVRMELGLPRVNTPSDVTSDMARMHTLRGLYGASMDNIDLFFGAFVEDHLPGAAIGPTFARLFAQQVKLARSTDRLWFENRATSPLSAQELDWAGMQRLSDVIVRNTLIDCLHSEALRVPCQSNGAPRCKSTQLPLPVSTPTVTCNGGSGYRCDSDGSSYFYCNGGMRLPGLLQCMPTRSCAPGAASAFAPC